MGKRNAASPGREFSVSSFILAIVCAYSASVQLNDIDWYFWLPLYSLACFVCLANAMARFNAVSRILSHVGIICGSVLLVKVVLQGCYQDRIFRWKNFMSVDMNQKLVREKFGSLLVCVSMWSCGDTRENKEQKAGRLRISSRSGRRLLAVITTFVCVVYVLGREEL
ncbi:hypothetical protein R1flu_009812 [Riccia fluitans]|uniref:Transmembrane protein 220 n=1 Tax=Riccia fluitans TaxID=41844 RepID=A0ABD1Z371_9MARC